MNVDDVLVSKSSGLYITIFRTVKAFTLVLNVFYITSKRAFIPSVKKIFKMAYQMKENF